MDLTIFVRPVIAAVLVVLGCAHARSAEPPTDGLLLWLDANRLGASSKAGATDEDSAQPVAVWPDASGQGRDAEQLTTALRPTLRRIGEDWVVHFDGDGDHLQVLDHPAATDATTIYLVVAPHRNYGFFEGFFSAGALNGRDYQTGINVDMGPSASQQLNEINIEGPGFGGARNLFGGNVPFGTPLIVRCVVNPEAKKVTCWVNDHQTGERPFDPREMSFEHFTIGGRYYSNDAQPHRVQSTFNGDLAEVLVYDRVLPDPELARVDTYLQNKHQQLFVELPRANGPAGNQVVLEKVADPPLVQPLVPGFRVRELPVEITNINNVRYRPDGKLITIGYDGNIHLLSDKDGDGLEETIELFWKNEGQLRGPIGIELTPPNYPHGQGVFVPSKGKVSLIVDTDGDDRADEERVIASGWEEIPQNVDAVGMARDKDGWLYFGIGTANYANAYLVDEQGHAKYDLASERGTVQRISPDFTQRETVCTGIRFPIAFAFNEHGDLFCTEQEGATWLPNGNPFDELLHIQPDRHYGFPPRHPRYNPNVIDEPSVFDYSPQHQSTCGMVFNRPTNGGPIFGPAWWRNQALVCGESRGKIWRTQLVKTEGGYVADTRLIAALQMLTVDACVAPDGALVVACHSGPPDWGTGPTGIGKLFRIEYVDTEAPQPVAAWATSPREVRLAFDRPLDPTTLRDVLERVVINKGPYVQPGDRLENLVPPYAVVQRQLAAPRFAVDVNSVALNSSLDTLVINTGEMRGTDSYSIKLPPVTQNPVAADIELGLELSGVLVEWQPAGEGDAAGLSDRAEWIPHLDLAVSKELTTASAAHQRLWQSMKNAGRLVLTTRLDVRDFLRPVIQPGSKLDFELPEEQVKLRFASNQPFKLTIGADSVETTTDTDLDYLAEATLPGSMKALADVRIELECAGDVFPLFQVSATTNEDDRQRALPLRRFKLPWVELEERGESVKLQIAEIEGGNWGRGRQVFHSEAASCFKCHALDGVGPIIGPDLSNLRHRDYASVLRDVRHPGYAINPDYLNQQVLLKDGRLLVGVIRTFERELLLTDKQGQTTGFSQHDVELMKPAAGSPMPDGLLDKLTEGQVRDLMTYLLTPPPSMPLDSPLKAPPVREMSQVAAVLAGAPALPETLDPLHIVLVAGPKDHGPGEHDYPAWLNRWSSLLSAADNCTLETALDFPTQEQLKAADILIFFQKGAWNDERAQAMDAYLARGGGSVYIHWAVNGDEQAADFAKRIGMASRGGSISYRHGPLTLDLHSTDHPIMRNLEQMHLYDESYWKLSGKPENVTLLASSVEEGMSWPQVWCYEKNAGRVFVSIPGHYSWTFDDPLFRVLLMRGIAWSAKQPIDRFNELVPLGARIQR